MSDVDYEKPEESKKLTGADVKADVDLPADIVINRRVEKTGFFGAKSKRTFKSITSPLAGIIRDLKDMVRERAISIKDKRIEQMQLELEISDDLNEIYEAETTVEFIEQVLKGVPKNN